MGRLDFWPCPLHGSMARCVCLWEAVYRVTILRYGGVGGVGVRVGGILSRSLIYDF